MIVFPHALVAAAEEAGMTVPPDPDKFEESKEQFPHFFVYCMLQLCRPITWGNHWQNAKIIAGISFDKLIEMQEADFFEAGFVP